METTNLIIVILLPIKKILRIEVLLLETELRMGGLMSKQEQTREKFILLPFSFLDEVGSAIYKFFGKGHEITVRMLSLGDELNKRGLYYIDTKKAKNEPARALTATEVEFLRESYSKSQGIF